MITDARFWAVRRCRPRTFASPTAALPDESRLFDFGTGSDLRLGGRTRARSARFQSLARETGHHLREFGDLSRISRYCLFGEAPLAFEDGLGTVAARECQPGCHVLLQTALCELRDFLRKRIHPVEPACKAPLVGFQQETVARRPAACRWRPLCWLRVLGVVRHDDSSYLCVSRLITPSQTSMTGSSASASNSSARTCARSGSHS